MQLRYQDHREHINILIQAALAAADPAMAVNQHLAVDQGWLRVGDLRHSLNAGKIFLIGVGKAAFTMGIAVSEILGNRLYKGILVGKGSPGSSSAVQEQPATSIQIQRFRAGHPVSDERGLGATKAVIDLLKQTASDDLVLCLISGGASALLTQPTISLVDWQVLVSALLASGCSIRELNAVRKQLDRIKGGGLARFASPAPCVSLILSDVVGNSFDVIGSGPTVPNPDAPSLAREILQRYGLAESLPTALWQRIEDALDHSEAERRAPMTAPPSQNFIISDVRHAASAAVNAANKLGFESRLLTWHLEGEASEVGRVAAALAIDAAPGNCLVLGGETTVTVRGNGKGGRNQELALAASISLANRPDCVLASFATDGEDGPTPAAGAVVTGNTVEVAQASGLDPHLHLANNDSYHFFQKTGGLLETGPTGTNVNDLVLILKY